MKLALAAACLVATTSLATSALADGRTVVTLAQPVAKTEFVANGGVWKCDGDSCVASYTPDQTFGVGQCHAVAKQAGAQVSSFTDADNHTLKPAELTRCNDHVPGAATTTASR